jgi:hypothetical protein
MGHRKQNKESTAVATPVKPVAEETATPSPDPTSVKQSFSKSYTRAFKQIAVPGKRAVSVNQLPYMTRHVNEISSED